MTGSEREALKAKIDEAVRDKVSGKEIDTGDVVIPETDVPGVDEETLARTALIWRDLPWRLFTTCTTCDTSGVYCCGKTRDTVQCLACAVTGTAPGGKRNARRRVMSTTTTAVSLREPFLARVREELGVEIFEAKAYVRVIEGKRTLAYVNGDRKLRIETAKLPPEKGVNAAFSVTSEDDFATAVEAIGAARLTETEPETTVEAEPARAAATSSGKRTTAPDPKPAKKRGRKKAAAK